MTITDFSNIARQQWIIVNDDVMGGTSTSQFQINKEGNCVFLGTLSLEKNGGFASVKNHEPIHLFGYTHIVIKLKGDGNRYSFRLQTGESGKVHRWSYEHRFDTASGQWQEIKLALDQFTPTYKGQTPKNVPDLQPGNVMRYGFLISDSQEGDFRLEIDRISARRLDTEQES